MTFSEVRQYQQGDDIRLIDWNVTARSGVPFIKVFEEERELTVILIVDISASGAFGSQSQIKKSIISETKINLNQEKNQMRLSLQSSSSVVSYKSLESNANLIDNRANIY